MKTWEIPSELTDRSRIVVLGCVSFLKLISQAVALLHDLGVLLDERQDGHLDRRQ